MKRRLKDWSIRSRLYAVIGVVTLSAMLIFAGLALLAEQRAATRTLASEQQALATLVANRSAAALLFGDQALARENLEALGGVGHVQSACLYDADGRLFTGFVAADGLPCAEAREPGAPEDDGLGLQAVVPVQADGEIGALVLQSSLAPVRQRLVEQSQTLGLAGLLGGVLALVLGAALGRLITGPILRLGAVVEGIDPASGRRAPVEGRDEVGQLAGTFNRMLDRLEAQTRGLAQQAEYNEVIFKHSPLPVIVMDPRTNGLVDCNDAAIGFYGLTTRGEALAVTTASVSTALQYDGTPTDVAAERHLKAALEGQRQVFDWRYRRPDGRIVDAEVHLTRFGPEDAPLLLASLFDVTERRAATAALQRMNDALESRVAERTRDLAASNIELSTTLEQLRLAQGELVRNERLASLGSLVAGIAHELNTPLGSALLVATTLGDGIAELRKQLEQGELKRSGLEAFLDQQAEAQALIVRNARRAAELIGRFKQVAVDQTSEQRRRFDLHEVVDEVLGTLQPRLRKTPHRLTVTVPEGLKLDSYPGPLGQVLTNLVMNALVHGLGEAPGEIRVDAHAEGEGNVELSVTDDGVGIPREHLARIFDPFFTTKLGAGGSGLGLHIVYSLVHRTLGGGITVDSTPGQGTCFRVTLPRVAPKATTEATSD